MIAIAIWTTLLRCLFCLQFQNTHAKILAENVVRLQERNFKLESLLAKSNDQLEKRADENKSLRREVEALRNARTLAPPPQIPTEEEVITESEGDLEPGETFSQYHESARASPLPVTKPSKPRSDFVKPTKPYSDLRSVSHTRATKTPDVAPRWRSGTESAYKSAHTALRRPPPISSAIPRGSASSQQIAPSPLRHPQPSASLHKSVKAPLRRSMPSESLLQSSKTPVRRISKPSISQPRSRPIEATESFQNLKRIGNRISSLVKGGRIGKTNQPRADRETGSEKKALAPRASSNAYGRDIRLSSSVRTGGLPPSSLSRFARASSRSFGAGSSSTGYGASVSNRLSNTILGVGNAMPRPSATPQRLARPSRSLHTVRKPLGGKR